MQTAKGYSHAYSCWVRQVENKFHCEDRYTWRHNNVLLLIALAIKDYLRVLKMQPEAKDQKQLIKFIPVVDLHLYPVLQQTMAY